jgi:hypothetical protein
MKCNFLLDISLLQLSFDQFTIKLGFVSYCKM